MNSPKSRKKSVRVHLLNLERTGALPENIEEDIRTAVLLAFERVGVGKSFQVAVILTSDREMSALNKRYLGKDRTTDVLAFPYSAGKFVSADIFVSVNRAYETYKDYGHTYRGEILFLVLHGILHLLGYNDRNESGRKRMWRKQEELLRIQDCK